MAKIAIIGGGVIGSSIAYYLALAGYAAYVVVIEPDPTYEFAATPRATGGIRQLFTVPENIRMAQYGHEIYGQFETVMAVAGDPAPIDFRREGYLWLGSGRRDIDSLIGNWRIQTAHDARVELLDRKGVKHRFPSMRVDDIDIAAFSPDDGYMDPHSVLMGFRRKAVSLGIRYLKERVVVRCRRQAGCRGAVRVGRTAGDRKHRQRRQLLGPRFVRQARHEGAGRADAAADVLFRNSREARADAADPAYQPQCQL
jgi:glycine/D-amino acid oxidase-like deaminating enzyme